MQNSTAKLLRIGVPAVLVLAVVAVAVYRYRRQPLTLTGAVIVEDRDTRKEMPIADVLIGVANDLASSPAKSDSSGFFSLRLFKRVRTGQHIKLTFRHPAYEPLDLNETASDKLYIAHLVPIRKNAGAEAKRPSIKIANVVVRYSFKTMRSVDVGTAVRTFEVANKANVPCNRGPVCSPDGKWKANIGSLVMDAGPGNELHDVRLSCIAGPCPFTRVESDNFTKAGQTITVSVRGWSDTTTFLVEAEVNHSMVGQADHRSYPVIFGSALNFTVPADAEGVSLEADVAGESIIFPLGPDLLLSWARCNATINADLTKVYHCELKPGYRFQS